MKHSLSIFICSCDKYSDIWDPFFKLFFKYWPDCHYEIYLVTNFNKYDNPAVNSLCVGEDLNWSSTVHKALEKVTSSHILFLQEDYLLTERVKGKDIDIIFNYIIKKDISYFRMYPCPGPDKIIGWINNYEIGEITKSQPFRTSLQAAIWNRQYFMSLLSKDESGWEFEMNSVNRSDKTENTFYSLSRRNLNDLPLKYFCTGVVQGYWLKGAVELCRKNGITVNTEIRSVQPIFDQIKQSRFYLFLIRTISESLAMCGRRIGRRE
ncbi:MAG TPA: hypothetical protein VMV04_25525 [Thermodesulfobacteriota bacterium]|nr:hypothetical protein [Thermodesulfobacteriota bacterium]